MRYFAKIRDFVRLHGFARFIEYCFFLFLRQLFCLLMAVLMFVSLMLLMLGLFYKVARAEVVQENYRYDGVVWGISDVEFLNNNNYLNVRQGCIVNAPNAFSAACYAVGGNPNDLTPAQRSALSNSSTGGDFYTFSQRFANYGGSFDLPDWDYPNFFDLWSNYESLYGDALYAADFTQAQLRGAKADFQTILSGGSLGGGSAPSNTYPAGYYYKVDARRSNYAPMPSDWPWDYYYIHQDVYDYFVSHTTTYAGAIYLNAKKQGNNYNITFADKYENVMTNNDIAYTVSFKGSQSWMTGIQANNYTISGNACRVTYLGQNTPTIGHGTNANWVNSPYSPYYYISIFNPSDYELVYLDSNGNNWPDNPPIITPIHNDVPNPNNPVIDDQPIDPTPPQNPIYPPILNITEDTYTADLQGILDAMDAHCQHLRSALHTEMSNLWTALSTKMTNDFTTFRTYMTGQIGWLGDLISDEMEATRDYLKDLFEWLADEFDNTFSGTSYDDNTLISWLRKIYYRLGSGGVNTRPVDPVSNPIDAGDWLSQLIANLFTALNALAGGLLTSVGSALDLMHTKFPFSLPWDLLAILALFEATPTAPDFDVPIYTVSSVGQLLQVGTWEIDLSDLSPYLEGIRWMQKICFVYFLAVHTKDWMDTLEKVVA